LNVSMFTHPGWRPTCIAVCGPAGSTHSWSRAARQTCVLGTVLGAVDLGYRIIIVTDGLCSSSDKAHDAMLTLYHGRYGQQVEAVATDTLLQSWA
jgi:hypothetical protein